MGESAPTDATYGLIDETRKELVRQVRKWKRARDMEMETLRLENENLRNMLKTQNAVIERLKLESRKLRTDQLHVALSTHEDPAGGNLSPMGRKMKMTGENSGTGERGTRAGMQVNGGVSMWNNTEEEKEKLFAVLKDGRT